MLKNTVLDCFGPKLKQILSNNDWKSINEIRLRIGKPLILKSGVSDFFVDEYGVKTDKEELSYRPNVKDIEEMLNMISDYSLYSVQEQLRYGFITVQGGHRAAFAGRIVSENNRITTIKNIGSIALRIAEEKKGCGREAARYVYDNGLKNTVIVSPVCGGKTTMLRDIVRILSNDGLTVGLADERGELAACYMGVAQLDVGNRTDVIDNCNKSYAMSMLIRTMSPDLICADEIGTKEDFYAIKEASLCGSAVICTVHGGEISDVLKRCKLHGADDIFDRFILLEGRKSPGTIKGVFDKKGERIC